MQLRPSEQKCTPYAMRFIRQNFDFDTNALAYFLDSFGYLLDMFSKKYDTVSVSIVKQICSVHFEFLGPKMQWD